MRRFGLSLCAALLAPAAFAQNAVLPSRDDTVSMSLMSEDWAQTQSARVELGIDAALPGSDAGKVRGEMLNEVKDVGQGAAWRITRFDRTQDSSGLEHWYATVEARLPETQLGGLSDRAKQSSKPGMQINVQTVDFTPALAEIEATRAKMRGDMYQRVNEALTQLNQAEPDRKYRIGSLSLSWENAPPQMPQARPYPKMVADAVVAQTMPIELSQKVQLRANVTFSARTPTP